MSLDKFIELSSATTQLAAQKIRTLYFSQTKKLNKNPQIIRELKGHSTGANCVAVLLNGNIISGGCENLRIWDSLTGDCLNKWKGHDWWINCITILSNGQVVSGSLDGTLKLWEPLMGTCLGTWRGHNNPIRCVVALPNGQVVSGSQDGILKLWDPITSTCLTSWKAHQKGLSCMAVLSNGQVISGSYGHVLKRWDPLTGAHLATWEGHTDSVLCVAVLPNGQVISGSEDKSLKLWDPVTNECLDTWHGLASISELAVLPNGQVISGGHSSCSIIFKLWNPLTRTSVATWTGNGDGVRCMAVLPNGQTIAQLYGKKNIMIWEAPYQELSLQEQKDLLQNIETNTSLTRLNVSNMPLHGLSDSLKSLLSSNKNIKILELNNTGLTNDILNKCIPALLSIPLKELNLSDNRLIYSDIRMLFNKLNKSKNQDTSIEKIILSGNLIEVNTIKGLEAINPSLPGNDCKLDLSGNLIISEKRNRKLNCLLAVFLERSGLSVGEFITLQFESCTQLSNRIYCLKLKKEDGTSINLPLSHKEIVTFNQLKQFFQKDQDKECFEFITKGLQTRRLEMPIGLKSQKYKALQKKSEKDALVKQLSDYYPESPVKSYMRTHSIFCHSPFTHAKSLLCPDKQITYDVGMIFLLADNSRLNEHAMIAYECVRGYRQRFFKVAHLTAPANLKIPKIEFYDRGVDTNGLITHLKANYLIAPFPASRKDIMAMHDSIQDECSNGISKIFCSILFSLSKGKIINCLFWACVKIETHMSCKISVKSKMLPSKAVQYLIDHPDAINANNSVTTSNNITLSNSFTI